MPKQIWDSNFFNKTTKRRYRALVWGVVEQDEGTIVGNIARNPKDRMQMAVMFVAFVKAAIENEKTTAKG